VTQKFHLGDEVATLCIIGKLYTDRCTASTVTVMIFMRITRRSGRPARDKQLRALNPIIQVKITHISVTCMFYKLTTLNRNIDCYWLNTIWEDTIMYKKRYKHLRLGHGRHCSGMKFRSQIRTSEHAPNLIGAPAEVQAPAKEKRVWSAGLGAGPASARMNACRSQLTTLPANFDI